MSSEYSMSVDWREEYEQWSNLGRNTLFESCTHKDGANEKGYCDKGKCDISEDAAEPIMNYAYPLYSCPSEEQILKIVNHTNLTVMEKDEDYYLALTGGGMDLSQDIGLAYMYAGQRIPSALASEISTQYGLSVSGKEWFKLMKEIKQVMRYDMINAKENIERINEAMKVAKTKS